MKNFYEISNLKYSAKNFETFWKRYGAYSEAARDDKYVARFETHKNRDTGFSVVLHFNRYTGERDTGCFRFGSDDLAQEYMRRAMNCLSKELFAKCAELLKKDAAKMVEAAEAELKSMHDMLEEVKKSGECNA
jgi:hypothetical protein